MSDWTDYLPGNAVLSDRYNTVRPTVPPDEDNEPVSPPVRYTDKMPDFATPGDRLTQLHMLAFPMAHIEAAKWAILPLGSALVPQTRELLTKAIAGGYITTPDQLQDVFQRVADRWVFGESSDALVLVALAEVASEMFATRRATKFSDTVYPPTPQAIVAMIADALKCLLTERQGRYYVFVQPGVDVTGEVREAIEAAEKYLADTR